jgi:hypothetical protein
MHEYQKQVERVERWYKRFAEIDAGKLHDSDSEYYQDDVYAFFLNCYHVKDWIIQDNSIIFLDGSATVKHRGQVTEDFINNCTALRICADVQWVAVLQVNKRNSKQETSGFHKD